MAMEISPEMITMGVRTILLGLSSLVLYIWKKQEAAVEELRKEIKEVKDRLAKLDQDQAVTRANLRHIQDGVSDIKDSMDRMLDRRQTERSSNRSRRNNYNE